MYGCCCCSGLTTRLAMRHCASMMVGVWRRFYYLVLSCRWDLQLHTGPWQALLRVLLYAGINSLFPPWGVARACL